MPPKRISLAEETAHKKRLVGYSVREVAQYLGVPTIRLRGLIRRLRMKVGDRVSSGQAAKLMLHMRMEQGEQILAELDKKSPG